jgi:hypothetical protein
VDHGVHGRLLTVARPGAPQQRKAQAPPANGDRAALPQQQPLLCSRTGSAAPPPPPPRPAMAALLGCNVAMLSAGMVAVKAALKSPALAHLLKAVGQGVAAAAQTDTVGDWIHDIMRLRREATPSDLRDQAAMSGAEEASTYLTMMHHCRGQTPADRQFRMQQLQMAELSLIKWRSHLIAGGAISENPVGKDPKALWPQLVMCHHSLIVVSYWCNSDGGTNPRRGWEQAMVHVESFFQSFVERRDQFQKKTFGGGKGVKEVMTHWQHCGGRDWLLALRRMMADQQILLVLEVEVEDGEEGLVKSVKFGAMGPAMAHGGSAAQQVAAHCAVCYVGGLDAVGRCCNPACVSIAAGQHSVAWVWQWRKDGPARPDHSHWQRYDPEDCAGLEAALQARLQRYILRNGTHHVDMTQAPQGKFVQVSVHDPHKKRNVMRRQVAVVVRPLLCPVQSLSRSVPSCTT